MSKRERRHGGRREGECCGEEGQCQVRNLDVDGLLGGKGREGKGREVRYHCPWPDCLEGTNSRIHVDTHIKGFRF